MAFRDFQVKEEISAGHNDKGMGAKTVQNWMVAVPTAYYLLYTREDLDCVMIPFNAGLTWASLKLI